MSKKSLVMQYAAMPVRQREGRLEVMLITSRQTGRWVIPKGWPKNGLKARELAALEAFEEAGLRGVPSRQPIGRYTYAKRLGGSKPVECTVDVFLLTVESEADHWPERGQRQRRWVEITEAALMVNEAGLRAVIESAVVLLPEEPVEP